MPEAADDQFGAVLQASELAPGEAVQVGDGVRQRVRHGARDTPQTGQAHELKLLNSL